MTKRTATPAAAGAAASAPAATVQTSAHQPTPPHPRDAHTGEGGRYVRDPATGIRTRVPDAVAPAAAVDPLAAEAESGSTTLP